MCAREQACGNWGLTSNIALQEPSTWVFFSFLFGIFVLVSLRQGVSLGPGSPHKLD